MPASEPAHDVPAPLSVARLRAVLEAEHIEFTTDEDGDLATRWEEGFVLYAVPRGERGEILCVTAYLDQRVSAAEIPAATRFCNHWNAETLWPKAYVRTVGETGDGHGGAGAPDHALVLGEVNADLESGVTDDQLRDLIVSAVSGSAKLAEAFGDGTPRD